LNKNNSIVVVQIGKIGDMILTTPLFSRIKNIFPEYELTVLASEKNYFIPELHSSVDKVIKFKKDFSALKSFISLKSSHIDYWIDTKNMYSSTSNMLVKNIKPERSLGFNYDVRVFSETLNNYTLGSHAIDINLSPLNFFNNSNEIFSKNIKPELTIPDTVRKTAEEKLSKFKGLKNILINFSAGSEIRQLSADMWIEVIGELKLDRDCNVLITGLVNDQNEIDIIINRCETYNIHQIRTESFFEFAAVIKLCDLVITPDTSAVHVCSAFNKPIVAIYSNVKWNYEKFRPLSDINEVVFSGNENNMEGIKTGSISEKIHKILPLI